VWAGLLSGVPSTAEALLRGRDPLAATRAAGTLLPGRRRRPGVVAGAAVHTGMSLLWTAVLTPVLRGRRHPVLAGAVAGVAIAALDVGLVARRWFPSVRALPPAPQWADHLAFGAVVGACARRHRR